MLLTKQDKQPHTDIHHLDLNKTYQHYLTRIGIYTIDQLFNFTPKEIGRIRGVGKVALDEITSAMDEWVKENGVQINHTPYFRKISNRIDPLIQQYPPTNKYQYENDLFELKLNHCIKVHLQEQGLKTINDIVLLNKDELVQTIHLAEDQRDNVIKAIKDFRQGIRQPKRLGTLYSFKNVDLYERDIQVLILSEHTENTLKDTKIQTLGDLSQYTADDLLTIDGVGQVRVDEIVERYKNYRHGTIFADPNDDTLPQSLNDSLNKFTFDTRTENGLKHIKGYESGDFTVQDLLNLNIRTMNNIRDFGENSLLLIMSTVEEWAELHQIDTSDSLFLQTYILPTTVEDQLYRLEFTERALNKLQEWNSDANVPILDLLNTDVRVFINRLNTLPSIAGKIVETLYIWCKEQNINPVGYKLFENDYLHKGVENYIKNNPVSIKNGTTKRKATIKRIEVPSEKGLLLKVLLVVRYNNEKYRISEGDELVKGYPIHFKLLERL